MAGRDKFNEQYEETRLIIEELLEDGSDPDALYTIEHHLSSEKFELLEKAAVEAFKLGYEVTDAEEMEVEGGALLFCCDAIREISLQAELIDEQVEQLLELTEKFAVNYDGWGTYFEGGDEESEGEFDDEEDDEEEEERRH